MSQPAPTPAQPVVPAAPAPSPGAFRSMLAEEYAQVAAGHVPACGAVSQDGQLVCARGQHSGGPHVAFVQWV